jgi:hypothetical protein
MTEDPKKDLNLKKSRRQQKRRVSGKRLRRGSKMLVGRKN